MRDGFLRMCLWKLVVVVESSAGIYYGRRGQLARSCKAEDFPATRAVWGRVTPPGLYSMVFNCILLILLLSLCKWFSPLVLKPSLSLWFESPSISYQILIVSPWELRSSWEIVCFPIQERALYFFRNCSYSFHRKYLSILNMFPNLVTIYSSGCPWGNQCTL